LKKTHYIYTTCNVCGKHLAETGNLNEYLRKRQAQPRQCPRCGNFRLNVQFESIIESKPADNEKV